VVKRFGFWTGQLVTEGVGFVLGIRRGKKAKHCQGGDNPKLDMTRAAA